MALTASVVVPTINEPDLQAWLDRLAANLRAGTEIIVVDDSVPNASYRGARVIAGPGRGKGAAVREGLLAAQGNVIVFVDADLDEATMRLIPEFILLAEAGNDVVHAERKQWRPRTPFRSVLSLGLAFLQRAFIFHSARFADTQCGFKAFRRQAAHQLARLQRIDHGMYDIEYLYIATLRGMTIKSMPVGRWPETRPSRMPVMQILKRHPLDLLRIKWNGLRGRYTR